MGRELALAEGPREKATVILVWRQVDDEGSAQRSLCENHADSFNSIIDRIRPTRRRVQGENSRFRDSMVQHTAGRPRVVAIMPARNSARTLADTVRAIPPGVIDEVILCDNASRDDTVAVAEGLGLTVVRHPVDRGFGGSIKTLFRTALAAGADLIVELHPDNQYPPEYVPAMIEQIRAGQYAFVIGSRFLPPQRALDGGMPWWKFIANRILTFLNNAMMGVRLSEYHSGLRVYDARWVRTLDLDGLSDDFKLGFQLVSQAVIDGRRIGEVPAFC
jgi:glycosyltransferase involved in cell wall biosynthesis